MITRRSLLLAGTAALAGCTSLIPGTGEGPQRGRRVRVWLTAMPMSADAERMGSVFSEHVRLMQSELLRD